jgi:lipoprotein-anchoring transpeptidase ErfK/SrfK
VRPRYGRIATLAASLAVTAVSVVGGAGLLPTSGGDADPAAAVADPGRDDVRQKSAEPKTADSSPAAKRDTAKGSKPEVATSDDTAGTDDTSLPAGSGEGRRVVFSESRQRVWLVDGDEVLRTYPVSGSVYDNLDPGTFHVYSRSETAVGVDDSGTMRWFVRFTTGDEGAAIGFHDIPVDDGRPVQTVAQLGTPQSHGCIRQRTADAVALWEFAPVGTTVVVTA